MLSCELFPLFYFFKSIEVSNLAEVWRQCNMSPLGKSRRGKWGLHTDGTKNKTGHFPPLMSSKTVLAKIINFTDLIFLRKHSQFWHLWFREPAWKGKSFKSDVRQWFTGLLLGQNSCLLPVMTGVDTWELLLELPVFSVRVVTKIILTSVKFFILNVLICIIFEQLKNT